MGLASIKQCSVELEDNNIVIISGKDRERDDEVKIVVQKEDYDDWQKGIPTRICFPNLSPSEWNFLDKGTVND